MRLKDYSIEIEIRRSKIKTNRQENENIMYSISREYFNEKTIIMTIRMPKSLYMKLEEMQRKYKASKSYIMRKALKHFVRTIKNDL